MYKILWENKPIGECEKFTDAFKKLFSKLETLNLIEKSDLKLKTILIEHIKSKTCLDFNDLKTFAYKTWIINKNGALLGLPKNIDQEKLNSLFVLCATNSVVKKTIFNFGS